MNTIGNYRVVDTQRMLIPNDADAAFFFSNEGERVNIRVSFQVEPDANAKSYVKIEGKKDHSLIRFINWRNELGTSTTDPAKIGTNNKGEPIFVMAASWKIGTTRILELQVMIGEAV